MTDELTAVLRVHLDQQRKQQLVVEELSQGIAAEREQQRKQQLVVEELSQGIAAEREQGSKIITILQRLTAEVSRGIAVECEQRGKMFECLETFSHKQNQLLESLQQSFVGVQKEYLAHFDAIRKEQEEKQGRVLESSIEVQKELISQLDKIRKEQEHLRYKQDQMFRKQDQLLIKETQVRTPLSSPVSSLHPRVFKPPFAAPFHSPPPAPSLFSSPPYRPRQASCPPIVTPIEEDKIQDFVSSLPDIESEISSLEHSVVASGGAPPGLDSLNNAMSLDPSSGFPSQADLTQSNQLQSVTSLTNNPNHLRQMVSDPVIELESFASSSRPQLHPLPMVDLSGGIPLHDSLTDLGVSSPSVSSAVQTKDIKLPVQSKKQLKDSAVVLAENPHLQQPSKIKALAVTLCRESLFGDDVLSMSTVTGRLHHPLCPNKLKNLKSVIRQVVDPNHQQSDEQFEQFVWKGITAHIRDYCKKIRSSRSAEKKSC